MKAPLIFIFSLLVLFCSSVQGQQAPSVVNEAPNRSTPRETVWSFLWWLQNKPDQWKPELAAQCLDFSRQDSPESPGGLAVQLKRWIDAKGLYVRYETLPDDPNYLNSDTKQATYWLSDRPEFQKIYLSKVNGLWLFSAETVAAIHGLYHAEFPRAVDFTLNHLPEFFRTEVPLLSIKLWQLTGLVFLLTFSLVFGRIARWLFDHPLRKIISKTRTQWDDHFFDAFSKSVTLLVTAAVLEWTFPLLLLVSVNDFFSKVFLTLAVFALICGAYRFSEKIVDHFKQRSEGGSGKIDDHLAPLIRVSLRVLVLSFGGVILLQSLGVNVGTLIAGLGIGGLAVALAAQSILSDLFASVSIALDKPFVVGDFIVFANFMGTVEQIGIKTTRIRSLAGEQLIFSNAELVKGPVQNFKRMRERRAIFLFGVTYQTALQKLKAIPEMVREILLKQDQVRIDRVHFKKYGDSSLDFEVVYWMKNPDYNVYMDVQQQINLDLFEQFTAEKIDFAYPTRTLYVESPIQEGGLK